MKQYIVLELMRSFFAARKLLQSVPDRKSGRILKKNGGS